jgi:hypothetical protein
MLIRIFGNKPFVRERFLGKQQKLETESASAAE